MSLKTPAYPGIDLDADEGPLLNAVSIAFISVTVYTIVILQTNLYGQHIGKSDAKHLEAFMKGLYALSLIYPIALSMSKLSLLALYWRIFAVTGGRIPIIVASVVNGAWGFAALFAGIFSCQPIQAFWHFGIAAKCISSPVFFTSNEAFTIVFDIVVLFIPVWFIAQIKRSVGERISISSTFVLGLVVTVVSAVRLWRLVVAQRRPDFDPTFNEIDAGLWATIELNLWVLVASIPTFRPLLGKIWRDHAEKKAGSDTNDSHPSSRYPLSKTKTPGTFFQKQQRDTNLETESVFGFADSKGSKGNHADIERVGTTVSSRTGVSGDSGFEEGSGFSIRPFDTNLEASGGINAYRYASQMGSGGIGERDGLNTEMRDLAGTGAQKEQSVRREAVGGRNAYGYACQMVSGGIGEGEERITEMRDPAGIWVPKERNFRREGAIWMI
ncbi:hypothetical protein NHQ30_001237 [Ciborinia camelliae]|nr:hypothetical protein NHQ30_001237 [Ciborinia camelliae]